MPSLIPRRPRRRSPIDAVLDRLRPALDGYPVKELVGLWAETPEEEAPAAEAIVDLCLSAWISSLDADTAAARSTPEAHTQRHHHARAALAIVRERFRRSACVPGRRL